MNQWKNISTAPEGQWVLVRKTDGFGDEHQGGPWDYGVANDWPAPKVMAAINIPRKGWRAYSEDGGIYGQIETPDEWMEIPE